MTQLERQIRRTQYRLWMNRWYECVSWSVASGSGLFAGVVLVQRLWDLPLPLLWIGVGLGAAALLASITWTVVTREHGELAAAKLDEAAGLKERISSGRYCRGSTDPFAQAVEVDAERISASVSVRQHIRLEAPVSLPYSCGAVIVAALMFLISPGVIEPAEAESTEQQAVEAQQTKIAIKRKLDAVRKLAENTPALEDLKQNLDGPDQRPGQKVENLTQVRHEAVKKIDRLADAVKQKRRSGKYDAAKETRKILRRLKVPKSSDAPTQKLAKALSQGDFKTAKEEVNALKEQLATLKSEKDQEMAAKLSKQLEDLSKQLEKLSQDKQLAEKLEQAGIKKEDMDRMLESLRKNDLDQLKKQLAQKGFSQKQVDQITKQLQQKQQAKSMAQNLSKSLQQASQCKNCGQMGNAMVGLSQAADQLSELETLEQEMQQLDTALADLQNAKDDLDKPCSKCGGTGTMNGKLCPGCKKEKGKGGMGRKMGRGRGGLAPEEPTDVGFKTERAKVHTGKGVIIGQVEFEGEQVKGEVTSSFTEVVTAAERDATDRIKRDRVPRQYRNAVKAYFSNLPGAKRAKRHSEADSEATTDEGAEGESDGQTESEGEGD